ncbi:MULTISPECIES: hypothetical protein [Flavobacteriaceae]|uniref:Lipocalin-like domain-containing protein n=2 Tax=Flavobacteriaceae TaxID=49546 RepID=A0A4Y8AVC7_9FLAO|nr:MULTISPECIES: hypothetical protein [Flavobacteriaceae]TEW76429.1 hypothetical protein E2488_00840 [Gramella jeungdoensis]GGK52766.1 hypothetical protein GCM10007963_21430 [Lutibacter litoralis]
MKNIIVIVFVVTFLTACNSNVNNLKDSSKEDLSKIEGTWKLVYGEIRENDSIQIRDISKSEFIKIINKTHFAFFNQQKESSEGFYGGAGTYSLNGNDYVEKLSYIDNLQFRNHTFPFKVEIKGDSLIQSGTEEVKELNMKRYIIEKYIRIK